MSINGLSFGQVVSGCEGGVVNIWDVDSGSLMVRMTECHGKNEITAMSLDHMGRLLMTGSSVGDIKVRVTRYHVIFMPVCEFRVGRAIVISQCYCNVPQLGLG